MGGGGGELQELSQQIQTIQEQVAVLEEEQESLGEEKIEIDDAIDALQRLESGGTVKAPLGGGAYFEAEVADADAITVELGGGYAAQRDAEGAIETLERKQDTLDDRIAEIGDQMDQLEDEAEELQERAQMLQQQQMQQQMQGRGPDE